MWHYRLGHIREDRINKLKRDGILGSLHSELYPAYESYLRRKITKLPFVVYGKGTTELLVLVHIDVCGPFDVQARGVIATSLSLSMIRLGMGMCI